ncbi:HLA class II histocompatibility antigen, DO beta chain-like [Scyliorhinus canicula]|uniref:HLA class II histocompatibility antigen, DO beta chain-like n=1 Tax=Scyliorhinus canicula TaxID=7830 RepID=UPI0018F569A1|nr:HLA class II histocompatibility antigen, DO beta chain-like [Scyliorhinus canicula]
MTEVERQPDRDFQDSRPTPLKIYSQHLENDAFVLPAVLCSTPSFFPKNISFTWYKDGKETTTGIKTVITLNINGLYEASSRLQETQTIRDGTVYTCLVTHSTLQVPASATHIVTYPIKDTATTHYLLISAAAFGGLLSLVLGIINMKRYISTKTEGVQVNDYPDPETKTNPLDKAVTYAALDMTGSRKPEMANNQDNSTEYAQIRMEKRRTSVAYMQRKAK